MLHSLSLLGPLRQSGADLIAVEADVFEIPVAEMPQVGRLCRPLAAVIRAADTRVTGPGINLGRAAPRFCWAFCRAKMGAAEIGGGGRSRYPAAAMVGFGVTFTASLP